VPTVLRLGRYRFYFFSNESHEPAHIHVKAGGDEAKYCLRPVALASNHGFHGRELREIERLIRQYRQTFEEAWNEYFDT
jgi:hypothetical protein